MRSLYLLLALPAFLAGASPIKPTPVAAQEPAGFSDRLNVSFDCQGRACDLFRYQAEILWVNWVSDPDDADVQVTMASDPISSGGFEYRVDFAVSPEIGEGDRLLFSSTAADSPEEELAGISTVLSIGLARYSTIAGFRDFVALRAVEPEGIDPGERIVSAQEVNDPWDLWVFTVSGSARVTETQTRTVDRYNANLSARRTTPTWKISISGRGTINKQKIQRSDGSNLRVDDRDGTFRAGITYTLADHWSLNLSSLSAKLPRFNQDYRGDLTPGIEYSLFPYEEATRRSLTLRYTASFTYRNYVERTIFGKLADSPFEHELRLRGTMRQPWGDASVTAGTSHILDDFSKYNISLRGTLSFRLVRGLNFDVGGNVAWVTDQLHLSAGGITDEEALLNLRSRRSAVDKRINFGFSYQFGSIYNNTVNNRFTSGIG